MGMGHLFRMINLYGALRESGADASIVLLSEYPPASEWLDRVNVPFTVLSDQCIEQPGWEEDLARQYEATVWVNDRLQTDVDHAVRVKELGLQLVTFDDLGGGAALADLHVSALAEVRGEKSQGGKVLTGLQYLILPPEIARYRRQRTLNKAWLISLGGSDTHGVTVTVAQWLSARQQPATLILGPGFEHEAELLEVVDSTLTIKKAVPSLAAEFFVHDVAITGGGVTAFEAAASGLPTMVVANEQWEIAHGLHLQKLGCSVFLGSHGNMDLSRLERPFDILTMSTAALEAVDTNGINRVCQEMLSMPN